MGKYRFHMFVSAAVVGAALAVASVLMATNSQGFEQRVRFAMAVLATMLAAGFAFLADSEFKAKRRRG